MGTATKTKMKKTPLGKGTLTFSTNGEFMTDQIRNSWVSDMPKHAFAICKTLSMTTEQALEVITGKKKLTGDTREGDGTLGWADDNTTEVCGIKLDVETMISRLENKWIDISEAINTFNAVREDLDSEESFSHTMKTLNGYKNELPKVLEQLQEVYSLVGKSLKDLPIEKVRSAQQIKKDYRKENPDEFEQPKPLVIESRLSRSMKSMGGSKNILDNMLDNIKKQKEEEEKYDKNDINRPFTTAMGGGKFYIVHCTPEKCKKESLHAGWLLPDGTFYAGDSMWIHRGILEELSERDFFKDKNYSSDEDDVQDRGNWIKFSGGDWMIWEHKHKLTKEQVEFIIDYTTKVDKSTYFKINTFYKIHISVFAKLLDGITQFDSSEMRDESEPIIKAEQEAKDNDKNNPLANFPTIDEVSEIDVLSTPFFQPDVDFIKWLIKYADGRIIIDCGAGSGYTTALINHLGGKCIAIEPHYNVERNLFWNTKGFHFHVFSKKSEEETIIRDTPDGKALLLFARPCHNGFVYDTIQKNMPVGMEALYISHQGNEKDDLLDLQYTKLKHEGTSKSNEYVLSIKK